jgi:predicted MFS family arabinose efflux permease
MLAVGAFLVGTGFGGMMFASDAFGIAITVVVWTFGEMILLPGAAAYMAEISPVERRGEYMGAFQMTFSLAFALSGWLGTLVLDEFGGVALWSGTFAAGVISAVMLLRIKEGR